MLDFSKLSPLMVKDLSLFDWLPDKSVRLNRLLSESAVATVTVTLIGITTQ